MTKAGSVLKALKGFHSSGKNQYLACCPAHDDKKASLSIGLNTDGTILLKCHAGCETDSILQIIGLSRADLFPEKNNGHKPGRNIVATYDYRDKEGNLLYQVMRLDPKDFRQRRPDGNGGWIPDTKGVERVPYNLQDVLENDYIYIVEGEKDAENLRKIGLTATCNAGGAGKWLQGFTQYFHKSHHITIIPDNDEPGRKHADQVAIFLHDHVASVKLLTLDGLPEKGDVSDWLIGKDSEFAATELARLSDAAEEWKPGKSTVSLSGRNVAGEVKEFIETIEGTFSTAQLYNELGLFTAQERTAARVALTRMKGSLIEPHGKKAGEWRVIRGTVDEMDFSNLKTGSLDLWMPFDLHNYVEIMPGNIIVITGDPDAGKTAFLMSIVQSNYQKWSCHYFNSEMGPEEMFKRISQFDQFPFHHPNFHAYERQDDFQDVIKPGPYTLNIIDFLEVTDEFYKVGGYINQIYKVLGEAVAIIAIQKRNRFDDMPLGGARALEKPRLVIALSSGSRDTPSVCTILKCKNRKTEHSMIGRKREYKLRHGAEFSYLSPDFL